MRKRKGQVFSNHYSYGLWGITVFKKSIAITEYGGHNKNDQHKQRIDIPTRYFREMFKFYLGYPSRSQR